MRCQKYFLVIVIIQPIPARGVHAAGHSRRTPGEDKHDVFAELCHLALVAGAESFPHTHQQEKRTHAPRDAKHCEEGAQFVGPQVAEDLRKDVQQRPHEVLPL